MVVFVNIDRALADEEAVDVFDTLMERVMVFIGLAVLEAQGDPELLILA